MVTPTPLVFVIEAELDEEPFGTIERPTPTVCCYEWTEEEIVTLARGFYGLNTMAEKFAYTGIVMNRYLSGAKAADGKPLFGSGSIVGIASNRTEFRFYDEHNFDTQENKELAVEYLNVTMTMRMTEYYTGYIFPSTALYLGWNENHKPVVYTELDGTPFKIQIGGK